MTQSSPADASRGPAPAVRPLLALLVLAAAIVGLAAWQVGPRPKPADAGLPKQPPPLALPSDIPETSPLARAAAQLATGNLELARAGFVDVVADDQDGEAGQVGLVLSRWRATGPVSVERDLRQLAREYPESALVALHLGLVQLVLGEQRAARESLRGALELGRDAADPTSLRMARLADDLLHPQAFQGTLPVLVQPAEVPTARRAAVAGLLEAAAAGDRRRAARLAAGLDRTGPAMARVAAAAAAFDKGEPQPAVDRLSRLAGNRTIGPEVRDRARLMATLAELWGGGDRAVACDRLARSASPATHAGTRRLAGPIHAELCARD